MCVHKYGLWMLWRNGRRLLCLLLAVMAVAVSANDANTYDSTVFVNKDVVITDSKFTWIPDEALRASWGIRAPYCAVSQVSGAISYLFDGDNASGFAWKAVSLKEKCPVGEINCVEEDRDGSVVAL